MRHSAAKANRWEDHYTRLARKERYPARSVYKLQEIQKRFAVIRTGSGVLDLGCAPGSWLMYAADLAGPSGRVVGVDLTPVAVTVQAHQTVAPYPKKPPVGSRDSVVASTFEPRRVAAGAVTAIRLVK